MNQNPALEIVQSETGTFLAEAFPSLRREATADLLRLSFEVTYNEGELVAKEGAYAAGIYVVRTGLLSVGKSAEHGSNQRVLRFLAPGEMFGVEAVFLEREPINVRFARALVDSTLLFFERANILAFSKTHRSLYIDLCRWLSREVIMLEFKLTRDAVESVDRNLALLLIALANKYGTKANGAVILDPPFPRQTMAEILGVSIETLLRSLKRFRERKLLTTSQSRITLTDDARLRETARTSPFYLSIIEETY